MDLTERLGLTAAHLINAVSAFGRISTSHCASSQRIPIIRTSKVDAMNQNFANCNKKIRITLVACKYDHRIQGWFRHPIVSLLPEVHPSSGKVRAFRLTSTRTHPETTAQVDTYTRK